MKIAYQCAEDGGNAEVLPGVERWERDAQGEKKVHPGCTGHLGVNGFLSWTPSKMKVYITTYRKHRVLTLLS